MNRVLNDLSLTEFTIPGSIEEYIDVNDIQIYVLAKVIKADGGKTDSARDKVGLNNLADMSLTLGESKLNMVICIILIWDILAL